MSKSIRQKKRLFLLRDFLLAESDEQHPLSIADMISYLKKNQISAERKTIYDDLQVLQDCGLDIVRTRNAQNTGYFVGNREFQLPELKLLVDSVQVSRFITHRKAMDLIAKLERLCSRYQGQQLHRQVFLSNRVKTHNESIYYNVDTIYQAIASNRQILFHYFDFSITGAIILRKDGQFYQVSPYAMTWSDQNYYMVAYDAAARMIKHYRVDKMRDMELADIPREGADVFRAQDMPNYTRRLFGMFSGKEYSVTLRFHNSLVGVVLDRMGQDTVLVPDGPDHFRIVIDVAVSPPFFGWLCGFRNQVEVLAPAPVRDELRQYLHDILHLYEPDSEPSAP